MSDVGTSLMNIGTCGRGASNAGCLLTMRNAAKESCRLGHSMASWVLI